MRKFPWEAHEALLVRCLLKALKGHYAQTAVIATCTASLARYHPSLSIHLTDVLLERVCLPSKQHLCTLPRRKHQLVDADVCFVRLTQDFASVCHGPLVPVLPLWLDTTQN